SGEVVECGGAPSSSSEPTFADPTFAQIVGVAADTLTVDTCAPNADCAASISTVKVSAPGLDLTSIPKSSYVTIQIRIASTSWVCTRSIVVESVPEWGGVKNPADEGGHTYLVAADGSLDTTSKSLRVTTVAQGCLSDAKGCT